MVNKIALISDLHLDFWARYYRDSKDVSKRSVDNLLKLCIEKCYDSKPDLIVLAGDVSNLFETSPTLLTDYDYPVVFVPGNHDYYHRSIDDSVRYIVNDDYVATTLWTNFATCTEQYPAETVYKCISDYYCIAGTSTELMKSLFQRSWELIDRLDKEIVITHFPPFQESIAEKYRGDPVNAYFVNDLVEEFLSKTRNTKLWICGHTHHAHHYYIRDTLVVCNPMGYPNENYKSIDSYKPVILEKISGKWWITE